MISLILRSIAYDLPATNISMPQVEINASALYQETLLSIGANINFTKKLRCLPAECLGLYLPHPYILEGIEHLKLWMQYYQTPAIIGHLLKYSLENTQTGLRSKTPIFYLNFRQWGYLAIDIWIK